MDIPLSRAKFNDLTYHLVQATREPVNQAINDSGVSIAQISKVLMVGGSSRIPAVQDLVQSITGSRRSRASTPTNVSRWARVCRAASCPPVQVDCFCWTSRRSLGIETLGGVCTRVIERNTTLPHPQEPDLYHGLELPVVGRHPGANGRWPARTKSLAASSSPASAAPHGVPQIEVTFSIDANGIVNVSARISTPARPRMTITASPNMSQADIDRAVREAQQYAAQDAQP